jgi:pantothenate kinase type III
MRLLADCGNSTVKLGLSHDGGIWLHQRLPPDATALDAFVREHDATIGELVILPGAVASAALVERWWEARQAGRPLVVIGRDLAAPDLGQYPGCGLDRVLAGLVACAQERRSLVVIDAGTATTLTAWRYDAAEPDPARAVRFAGGLILPGARACLAGLAATAPALPAVEPAGHDAKACQHDTAGALAAAVGIGYGPMVAACLAALRRDSGIDAVLATGGDVQRLIDAGVVPRLACRPSLVLEGIELWRQKNELIA